jgi:hypothetical protein
MPARMRWQENPRVAGFSLRTGIPGLSYRQSWGKNAGGAALIMLGIMAAVGIAMVVLRILAYLLPLLWQCLQWIVLTIYDFCVYGMQQFRQWRAKAARSP